MSPNELPGGRGKGRTHLFTDSLLFDVARAMHANCTPVPIVFRLYVTIVLLLSYDLRYIQTSSDSWTQLRYSDVHPIITE